MEYDAWLQPGAVQPIAPMLLTGPDCAAFAMAECQLLLQRLFGEKATAADAACKLVFELVAGMQQESYRLSGAHGGLTLAASGEAGFLYGVYRLLRELALGAAPESLSIISTPSVARRVLNHWDNIDGSIERGYSGKSIFFKDGKLDYDSKRIQDYARLLASVGINQIALNNVNVTPESAKLISAEMLPAVAAIADIFRPFQIKLVLSIHFESPVLLGGLQNADPLDAQVAEWWQETATRVYEAIPDFAGFLVKADSEFRSGPTALGRTQADGANVIAKALAPHGGIVYWRCFIYNCMQDWRDTVTDRPMAAYNTFMPLDGKFADNVVLQIKNGPSDFQVREPNSPLLSALQQTRCAMEFQITQEYTGHQIDLYALAVQWQEVLDAPVSDTLLTRETIGNEQRIDTLAAVANVGLDANWTGNTLAQANLYAFGRMVWETGATAETVLREWVALTFGLSPDVNSKLTRMLLQSRAVYEKYNAPLGIGWMVTVHNHYGPSVDGYEYMRWGTYHRADHHAIGIDRTEKGTGYTAQYHPWLNQLYSDPATCPEAMLLFFHRLPYSYRLKNGNTLIQHIYDTHFEGVSDVEGFLETWRSLQGSIPKAAWDSIYARLQLQLENAKEWRDVINTYFHRLTAVPDSHGRRIYP